MQLAYLFVCAVVFMFLPILTFILTSRPHTFSSTSATISSITSISATSTNKLRSSMSSMSSTTGDRIHGVKQLDSNPILYGTAWKKERTTALVLDAINSGYMHPY